MDRFKIEKKRLEVDARLIPCYIKEYINEDIKKMEDIFDYRYTVNYIESYESRVERHKRRIRIIKKSIVYGKRDIKQLRKYMYALSIMADDLLSCSYNDEDKGLMDYDLQGKVRDIAEGGDVLEIKILKVIKVIQNYIRKVERSNHHTKKYVNYMYNTLGVGV